MEWTSWYALRIPGIKASDITEYLSMNGYTFETNGEDILFVHSEEIIDVEVILNDEGIAFERL